MILHIMIDEKVVGPLVDFINKNFDANNHRFIIFNIHKKPKYITEVIEYKNVFLINKTMKDLLFVIKNIKLSSKIILHSLFTKYLLFILALEKKWQEKSFWVIYGGDLYDYKQESLFMKYIKTKVISNLRGIITPVEGDYYLAKNVYKASGKYFAAQTVNSVITTVASKNKDSVLPSNNKINILVGNSADPENRHSFLINKLEFIKNKDVTVFIPLSYGNHKYGEKINDEAKCCLGDKAIAMFDFMSLDEYTNFLGKIDVALFAHKRQQAFCNIIQLLYLGAKVYLDKTTTTWNILTRVGIKVFDIETAEPNDFLNRLDNRIALQNKSIIVKYFSMNSLLEQWRSVFDF